jgi:hypothetical protein
MNSFLKDQEIYVLVYTNPADIARESGVNAVIRICFGSDENSISIPYARFDQDRRGYQMPAVVVVHGGTVSKLPLITGPLWEDLVGLADIAMRRVKEHYPKVPMGQVFKVYRDKENKTIVKEYLVA